MRLGIPRGHFYYDYIAFLRTLFEGSDIELIVGAESDERMMNMGTSSTVDEACMPVKLMAGQIEALAEECDRILLLRVMKDIAGRWLCPKLLGSAELFAAVPCRGKLLVSEPVFFNKAAAVKRSLWKVCRDLNMSRRLFAVNFTRAYNHHSFVAAGRFSPYVEAAWEFTPELPGEGEIILPNNKRVLLAGHSYNVYDRFANGNIMKKLDQLGIDAVTEKAVAADEREDAIADMRLEKNPFWEAFVRIFGSALCLRDEIDGIVYLSSFSCGTDAFTIDMIKNYIADVPLLVLKLDGQRGEAGYDTRLEAFADLLEKRRRAS